MAATAYWITFRISEDTVERKTYEDRYDALQNAIAAVATTQWVEPTSFIAFESAQTIDAIAKACKAAIAPTHDLFLIREMNRTSARICGKNSDQSIFKLMPYLTKV